MERAGPEMPMVSPRYCTASGSNIDFKCSCSPSDEFCRIRKYTFIFSQLTCCDTASIAYEVCFIAFRNPSSPISASHNAQIGWDFFFKGSVTGRMTINRFNSLTMLTSDTMSMLATSMLIPTATGGPGRGAKQQIMNTKAGAKNKGGEMNFKTDKQTAAALIPPKSGLSRMSYPFSSLSTVSFTKDMLPGSLTLRIEISQTGGGITLTK